MLYNNNIMKWIMPKIYTLVLLFVFAQTASLLHAEIHPFHEHTEVCDAFHLLEHQAGSLINLELNLSFDFLPLQVLAPVAKNLSLDFCAFFLSRAPPYFLAVD